MKFRLSLSLLLLTGCQSIQAPSTHTPNNEETTQVISETATSELEGPLRSADQIISEYGEVTDKATLSVSKSTPQSQEDLWRRISMQFSIEVPDHKAIEQHRKWFIKHPQHLEKVAKRATPFLYLITEKVEERGFPLELALLPIVESSFDVRAYSHGNASGLWQFLSGTGKIYGLEQSFWYDGRRDVYAATDAALDYLAYLNKFFDGNWYHAIAAYNSGEGRVARSIKRNKKANKPTDFFSLSLPKETSQYVPKLLALADVLSNQEKYGISIPQIANKPYLKLVDPKEQMDLRIAANYAGIDFDTMNNLNPAYNQWATSPKGVQQLLIPLSHVDQFNNMLEKNRGKGVRFARYTVKRGDTLSTIAARNNIPTTSLKETNNLKRSLIRVGQTILVPSASGSSSPKASNQTVAQLDNSNSTSPSSQTINHKVKSGDNLWDIAKLYNVSHQAIARLNNIKSSTPLKIGQNLKIKQGTSAPTQSTVKYTVKSGDTLGGIAMKYDLASRDIMKWNKLSSRSVLQIGQTLTLKDVKSVPTQKTTKYKVKSGDTLSDIAMKFNTTSRNIMKWNKLSSRSVLQIGQTLILKENSGAPIQKAVNYKVKSGDTLSAIAMRFNLASRDIMKWNKLSQRAVLQIGQTLTLYVKENT